VPITITVPKYINIELTDKVKERNMVAKIVYEK
jgi:hypothetical protein